MDFKLALHNFIGDTAQGGCLSFLGTKADAELNKLKTIIDVDVPKFNTLIRDNQMRIIGIKKE